MTRRGLWGGALLSLALVLATAEVAARIDLDFPLYEADGEIGYWLRPNQSGVFLDNDWAFNTDSLGVPEEFAPSRRVDLLLVGDSIVMGGNTRRQAEKLGPLIERMTDWQVWPASAGSWAIQNELAFLRRKPHLVEGADVVLFVVNSGDFAEPSAWASEYTHPRKPPTSYLLYALRRYVLPPEPSQPPMPVKPRPTAEDWVTFVHNADKPVMVLAYTSRKDAGSDCDWIPPAFLKAGEWYCYDANSLGSDAFAQSIHPSGWGNRVLARSVVKMLREH